MLCQCGGSRNPFLLQPQTNTLNYVSSAFDTSQNYYYSSYLVMNSTDIQYQSLVTVDVVNKRVVSDIPLKIVGMYIGCFFCGESVVFAFGAPCASPIMAKRLGPP